MIEAYEDGELARNAANRAKVKKLVKERCGDALVWLSHRVVHTGSFSQVGVEKPGAALASGAHTGGLPGVLEEPVEKGFRNTVLLIRWK